jgi:hypothetical protein
LLLYWLSNSTIGFVVLFIKKNRLRSVSFIVHTPITSLSYLNSTFGVVVVLTNGIYFIDTLDDGGLRKPRIGRMYGQTQMREHGGVLPSVRFWMDVAFFGLLRPRGAVRTHPGAAGGTTVQKVDFA